MRLVCVLGWLVCYVADVCIKWLMCVFRELYVLCIDSGSIIGLVHVLYSLLYYIVTVCIFW